MVQLEVRTPRSKGTLTMAESPLGRGGEGAVHSVLSHSVEGLPPAEDLVVKIYHSPKEGNRREKIISMVSSPPDSDMFAWPLALAAQNGAFVGYVMEKLRSDRMKEWAHLAHTATRREIAPDFDVRYAIAACLNYAIALESLHRAGHMQGDANESNSFVGADASVTIVDTDSAQIRGKDGKIFRCEVGKPEYTAAELIGKPLREQDRTVASDGFAFGVLLFQMLTGGAHQTDGIYTGTEDPPSTTSKISQGVLPMLRDESARGFRPVPRIAVAGIPTKLKGLILALSDTEPQRRPSFERIVGVLRDVQENLTQCPRDSAHWFDSRDGSCGWCRHAESGQVDPWGKPRKSAQSKLPPVSFGEQKAPSGQAPRASINPPRHQSNYAPTAVQQNFPRPQVPAPSRPSTPAPQPQIAPRTALSPQAQQLLNQANGQQPQQSIAQQPTQRKIPDKIKGKMTVIYPDGSYGPRPALGVLFSQNNKLWRQAIATEWPGFLKLWWPADRPVAKVDGLLISPLIAAATLTLISWLLNLFLFSDGDRTVLQIGVPLLSVGTFCSSVAFIIWWINGWVGRARARKDYGSLANVRQENATITVLRSFGITLGYIFTPIIGGAGILIVLIKTMIRGDRQNRVRW